jgi:hypothetical protein
MDVVKAVAKIANNPGRGKVITVVDTANGVIAEEFNNALSAVTCTSFAVTQ